MVNFEKCGSFSLSLSLSTGTAYIFKSANLFRTRIPPFSCNLSFVPVCTSYDCNSGFTKSNNLTARSARPLRDVKVIDYTGYKIHKIHLRFRFAFNINLVSSPCLSLLDRNTRATCIIFSSRERRSCYIYIYIYRI